MVTVILKWSARPFWQRLKKTEMIRPIIGRVFPGHNRQRGSAETRANSIWLRFFRQFSVVRSPKCIRFGMTVFNGYVTKARGAKNTVGKPVTNFYI